MKYQRSTTLGCKDIYLKTRVCCKNSVPLLAYSSAKINFAEASVSYAQFRKKSIKIAQKIFFILYVEIFASIVTSSIRIKHSKPR